MIAVWFSCGAASAVAAKLTLEKYEGCEVRVLNNPIQEEDADNRRFLSDVEKWLSIEIEIVLNPKHSHRSAKKIWDEKRFMSGTAGAPCTSILKKEARAVWERKNHVDWHVLGFCLEEKERFNRFSLTERPNTLPILIEAELTKQDCFNYLVKEGLRLPMAYYKGYPNANCIGCVKATSPTYWNHVRKTDPDIFRERANQSRELGAKLARFKGDRVFLDELPEDAVGRPMKSMNFECGIFCEEGDGE